MSYVHHYRVALSGPAAAVAAVAAALGERSGQTEFIVVREVAIDFWETLSREHRRVAFGVEYFQEFTDEVRHVVIHDGETTEMSRESLRPRYQVYFDREDDEPGDEFSEEEAGLFEAIGPDDEGEPMDEARVRMAARLISEARDRHAPPPCDDGLAVAYTIGKDIGRLCGRTEQTARSDPSPETLDAVLEIAVHALCMRKSSDLCPAERDFRQALMLTESVVHAASTPNYYDSWSDWLRILIGGLGHLLDAATAPHVDGSDSEIQLVAAEHYSTPREMLDLELRATLVTCIEALALFGDADRASAR